MNSNCNGPRVCFLAMILIAMLSPSTNLVAQQKKQLVRLAVITVDSAQVSSYTAYLREEIEASIRLEPGVITLYGVSEKENAERVTLFETYADSSEYKAHLSTPHFQKYKNGTIQMVKHLELIEMQPIFYHRKSHLSKAQSEDLYIRLIKMEIDSISIAEFNNMATSVMLPGIKNEPGVLVMYVVAEKNHPSRISILEVYANLAAYENHIRSAHFLKYKEESKKAVRSLTLIDVNPILLGSKQQ